MIGGDFNTQIGVGPRGDCLDIFVRTFAFEDYSHERHTME